MKERAIEIKVGILVLVALGILGGFIFLLGNFSVGEGFSFHVDFDFSGNLQAGAPVKVAGIKVGKVQTVEYLGGKADSKTGRRVYVRVTAWVESQVQGTIYEDAEFFINTQGVLGEQYLEVVPGTPAKPAIQPGQVLLGVTPPRMDLVVARLYELLDGVTRLLREDKDAISNLLRAGTKALTTIDQLLVDNQKEINQLLTNLDTFTGEASALVKTVHQGVGQPHHLRRLLGGLEKTSVAVGQNIDSLLAKVNRTLDGVTSVSEAFGPEEKKNIRQGLKELVQLSQRVNAVTAQAQTLVQRLNQGHGTAGALLAKEELYHDLKEMVRDLKRNPWKFLWRE